MSEIIPVLFRRDSGVTVLCNALGQNVPTLPAITYGVKSVLRPTCVNSGGVAVPIPACATWVFVLDVDWNTSTPPLLLVNSGITVDGNAVSIPLNANTAAIITLLNSSTYEKVSKVPVGAELRGYDTEGEPAYLIQFDIDIVKIRYDGGSGPEAVVENYYTIPQVDALFAGLENKIKAADVYQYSETGSGDGHDTRTSADKFYRQRKNIEGSTWSAWLDLPRSELIIDTKTYNFSTTDESANPLVISKTTLGIASDAEPQVSVWLINVDGSKQLAGDSVIPVKSYTADGTSLSLTYYQTAWPVANWQIKMS